MLRDSSLNSLSFYEIHYLFHEFSMSSLSASLFHFEFTIFFSKSLWIHYLFRKLTFHYLWNFSLNSLYFSRIHLESTLFRKITMDSLSPSQFHYEVTIFFTNSIWIHYFIPKITMNTLFFSRNQYLITICFANSS